MSICSFKNTLFLFTLSVPNQPFKIQWMDQEKVKKKLLPKQKRSIATKNKIKKTARKLFAQKGYYKVTTNMIAKEAEVPIGSFYNYFENKEDLILELIKDFNDDYYNNTIDQFNSVINRSWKEEDILDYTIQTLEIFILNKHLSDPFLKVIHALQFTEEEVLKLSEAIRTTELDTIEIYLNKVRGHIPVENIELKAKLIHVSAENLALYINHLGIDFSHQDLIRENAQMILSYLRKN